MENKISQILNLNLKNYHQDEHSEIIQRLALIGLRSLQLESKEQVQIDQIKKVSNSDIFTEYQNINIQKIDQIVEKMNETGHLRQELSNIKEQLSKLSNKFEILSSEKKQNNELSLNLSSNLSTSHASQIKHGNLIPPQPHSKQNLVTKENRQNQFLSQQRLNSLPNSSSNKALNTPQNQKSQSNSQTRLTPQHKLFECNEISQIRTNSVNKKPSSAWRSGNRSNSSSNQKQVNEDDNINNSEENILPSNINDSEIQDIQKRKFMKNHEQVAPKITETKPQTSRNDSVKTTTRHHLDDKHIKDILSEDQIQKYNTQNDNQSNDKLNINNQIQSTKNRKKWDSVQQQSTMESQFDQSNETFPNMNGNQLNQYVSLSQNQQQFLLSPHQSNQNQLQSFQNFNDGNIPQQQISQQTQCQNGNNTNFTSPKFKEGKENSINTQFNSTEQKKVGQQQTARQANYQSQQTIHIQNQVNAQPQSQGQQQQQQQKKINNNININNNTNNNNNNINNNMFSTQIQQNKNQQPQQKYATTKSMQKRQEISKQKKNQDSKKDTLQNTKKQPTYLKNITSKIKDEVRLQKEAHRGSFNHEVEIYVKEPHMNKNQGIPENKSQTHRIQGSQFDQAGMKQNKQRGFDIYKYTINDQEYEQNDTYNDQQEQYNNGKHMNTYGGGYQSIEIPNNYEQDENNYLSSNIQNYNQKRFEHKYNKQIPQYFGSGHKISEIPPVPTIDESYNDFRNDYMDSQNQPQQLNNNKNNYGNEENNYLDFEKKYHQYSANNYEDMMRSDMYNNQTNKNNYKNNAQNNHPNHADENFNHMNIPNYNQHNKSTSSVGEQNSFNYKFNDQSSFYSNNKKAQFDQQNNNVNITTNSQNLLSIANNLLQSPLINQFSNVKQNNKDTSITDQDQYQIRSKKVSQTKPIFPEQHQNPYFNNGQNKNFGQQQNEFDQFNDSQNASSIQQSLNDISYKKMASINHQFSKNLPENLDQSSMLQDNYEKENTSISSSFTSFKPDNNMKEVLQKDGFFQKMFEGDDQFSHQKFDNTFTSHHKSNNNFGNIMSNKSQTRQQADLSYNNNNQQKDDSMIIKGYDNNYNNPTIYSQIQSKMEINQNKNDFQFDDDDDENEGAMMDKRLYNFFADQS